MCIRDRAVDKALANNIDMINRVYNTGDMKAAAGAAVVLDVKDGSVMEMCIRDRDSDYRGELKVPMVNLGREAYTIQPGERVAQLCIAPV